MGLFKNLFSCSFNNTETETQNKINDNVAIDMKDIRNDIKNITNDVNVLFRINSETNSNVKRLEDKINNNFSLLTNKIDNVIMILNRSG